MAKLGARVLMSALCAVVTAGVFFAPAARALDFPTWTVHGVDSPADVARQSGGLISMSCPHEGTCFGVGSYLIETGQSPQIVSLAAQKVTSVVEAPLPADAAAAAYAYLAEISCWSVTGCVAVGGYADTSQHEAGLVETYDGTGWTPLRAPGSAPLDHVACNPDSCVATGSEPSVLLVRAPAGTWSAPAITLDSTGRLSVTVPACPATGSCRASGVTYDSAGGEIAAVYLYPSGDHWRGVIYPAPAGVSTASIHLTDMSCSAYVECMAVGSFVGVGGRTHPLVERLHNGRLSARIMPLGGVPNTATFSGYGVSCWQPTACTAYANNDYSPIFYHFDGTNWDAQYVQFLTASLADIDCSSVGSCVAVGTASFTKPFEATYRASDGRWLPVEFDTTEINRAYSYGSFDAVSCAGRVCAAGGDIVKRDHLVSRTIVGIGRDIPNAS
jgi:hypothetical protein